MVAQLADDDRRTHWPGLRGGRHDPDGADHHSHPVTALTDARRHDDVRLDRVAWSAAGARARWMAGREHQLELVLLYQPARMYRADHLADRRAALGPAAVEHFFQGGLGRHYRPHDRPELVDRGARRRSARTLVRIQHDHLADLRVARRHGADRHFATHREASDHASEPDA